MNSDYCPDCSSHPRRQYTILRGAGNTAWCSVCFWNARDGSERVPPRRPVDVLAQPERYPEKRPEWIGSPPQC
jgi:hypothetical protein